MQQKPKGRGIEWRGIVREAHPVPRGRHRVYARLGVDTCTNQRRGPQTGPRPADKAPPSSLEWPGSVISTVTFFVTIHPQPRHTQRNRMQSCLNPLPASFAAFMHIMRGLLIF